MNSLDLDRAAETFALATDLTVGVEEEFSILDPHTLELLPRFEQLRAAGESDPVLRESVAGELISSEIEVISGVGADLHDALTRQRERRRRLFALAAAEGVALGATGTHPWADYREQPIIDTEHYRRVEEGLKYVAWRNNTFSLHVHVAQRLGDAGDHQRGERVGLPRGRLRVADPHLYGAEAEVRPDRPPHLGELDDRVGLQQELDVLAVGGPAAKGVGHATAREALGEALCAS